MNVPKITTVNTIDDHTLLVQFDNHEIKKYNITPLFEKTMFAPLKNKTLFNAVKVEQGGYAVSWNNEIDISEYELWTHGETAA